jgi:hypothetical protein
MVNKYLQNSIKGPKLGGVKSCLQDNLSINSPFSTQLATIFRVRLKKRKIALIGIFD